MIIFLLRASTINSEKGLKHEEPEQKQTFWGLELTLNVREYILFILAYQGHCPTKFKANFLICKNWFIIGPEGNHEHKLVKRQDDEYSDRRRLKTKFVNGVEVLVRGKGTKI